jgi:hypothetical protein
MRARGVTPLLAVVAMWAGCSPPPTPPQTPSDDPADWEVDPAVTWEPVLGAPRFVVPARNLPVTPVLPSNNNADLLLHDGRLYFGWRTSQTHFASDQTRLHVLSSGDLGQSWTFEHTIYLQTDMREPLFLSIGGRLFFHWFEAGTDRFSFEPKRQWRIERKADGGWTGKEAFGPEGEITWSLKKRGGVAWRTSYVGNHYMLGQPSDIAVSFTRSGDGLAWEPVKGDGVVYRGGVSEVAFEFARDGTLWAVTRNEDGDATGFGSHVCSASPDDLGTWTCSARSDPERYDSPKLLRHGDELYLVARRDVGGPFDQMKSGLPFADQQLQYLAAYSGRAKRTALYRLDTTARKVVHLFDLPSAGDTAFPSIVRLDAHRFLISNYTSPLDGDLDRSWWNGQNAPEGTKLYLVELTFQPR